jgi:hypothetical protein
MAALTNAFGFGGHNVALAFTEYVPAAARAEARAEAGAETRAGDGKA